MNLHPTDELSIESVCDILRDERRRYLVAALAENAAPATVSDLAAAVAARERDADPSDLSEEAVRRAAISLHHHHLPKLDDAGVVTYHTDTRTVSVDGVDGLAAQVPDEEAAAGSA